MNRGNIPGYYWDADKKKYFKIQANHLVPETAKYAKGNVNQEKRLAKKRKIEEQQRIKRQRQTITAAPALKSSVLGGIGLLREQGFRLHSRNYLIQSDLALLSQWTTEHAKLGLTRDVRLQAAHYIPDTEQMIIAATHVNTGVSALYACNWIWDDVIDQGLVEISGRGLAAFNSNISSITTATCDTFRMLSACAEAHQAGNVFMGTLPGHSDEQMGGDGSGVYLTLGGPPSRIIDSSTHPISSTTAVMSSTCVFIVDRWYRLTSTMPFADAEDDWKQCTSGIHWLDANTVVYGARDNTYNVMLWDVRTPHGKTARFQVRDRITGVFNPSTFSDPAVGKPHEILASTNKRIDCFDTRMPIQSERESPVLSFAHVHGGPKLQCAAKGALVAAVDRDNIVQIYSLRTGTKLNSLESPEWQPKKWESPALRNLMWYDDRNNGPTLQAVRGNGVVRWTYSCTGEEE